MVEVLIIVRIVRDKKKERNIFMELSLRDIKK